VNLVFGNPWGFLGFLGIPLLVLIYYLRRRAQVETVTTLFLLARTQRETKAGRRFETFSNSLPFWLQVLAVLLLTWLLVNPRYGNNRVTQQIAVVMDSSASMQALKKSLPEKLREALEKLKGSSDHASYLVLDHNPRNPRIYQGDQIDDLVKRLDDWDPRDGALDPRPVLRIARSLVGPTGVVVYVTDHDGRPLPAGSQRLALGEAKANCGFTGATVEPGEPSWTAILRNYGESPQTREWSIETLDGRRTDPREVNLPPRQFVTLRGKFPEGSRRCVLRLSGDALPIDDVMPLVVNEPKLVRFRVDGNEAIQELGERMDRGFSHVAFAETGEQADFDLRSIDSGAEEGTNRPTIFFYQGVSGDRPSGAWLARDHELTQGLNFQAMTIHASEEIQPRGDDEVLLWLEGKPVIVLRRDPLSQAEQLVFAFDLPLSNAIKIPAVAVLLHRFAERLARETITPHTAALETGQQLLEHFPSKVAREDLKLNETAVGGSTVEVELADGFRMTQRAPKEPGFLALSYKGEPLMEASVVFADTREADLSRATTVRLPDVESKLMERRTREDRWWRIAALLLLAAVVAAWYLATTKESS
jgi:hypothetical protein